MNIGSGEDGDCMTPCPNPTHARDVRRVAGCSCGTKRAKKDTRKAVSPARAAALSDANARTRRIPRSIFAAVDRVCDAVRERPELAKRVNEALAEALA